MPIELPFPAKILWPNGRGHHMVKHRAFQRHKQWAWAALMAEGLDGSVHHGARIAWSVTIHPKTRNAIDDDNARASLKAYQDGFAKALGVDDALFLAPELTFGEPIKGGRVVVQIG